MKKYFYAGIVGVLGMFLSLWLKEEVVNVLYIGLLQSASLYMMAYFLIGGIVHDAAKTVGKNIKIEVKSDKPLTKGLPDSSGKKKSRK